MALVNQFLLDETSTTTHLDNVGSIVGTTVDTIVGTAGPGPSGGLRPSASKVCTDPEDNDEAVALDDNMASSSGTPFSFTFWFKGNVETDEQVILGHQSSANHKIGFTASATDSLHVAVPGSTNDYDFTGIADRLQWNFYSVIRNSDNLIISRVNTINISGSGFTHTGLLSINKLCAANTGFLEANGEVADVRFYNHALTLGELGALYYIRNPSDIIGVTHWWDPSDPATITLVSGKVAQMDDKIGSAHLIGDFPDPTDFRPVMGNAPNGRSCLDFGADNNDHMQTTGIVQTQDLEVWASSLTRAYQAGPQYIFDSNNKTGPGANVRASGVMRIESDDGFDDSDSLLTPLGRMFNGRWLFKGTLGTDSELWIDNVSHIADVIAIGADGITAVDFTIGADSAGNFDMDGLIGELFTTDRELSDKDITDLWDYMINGWQGVVTSNVFSSIGISV